MTLCGSDYYLRFPEEDIAVREVIKSAKNFSMDYGSWCLNQVSLNPKPISFLCATDC